MAGGMCMAPLMTGNMKLAPTTERVYSDCDMSVGWRKSRRCRPSGVEEEDVPDPEGRGDVVV